MHLMCGFENNVKRFLVFAGELDNRNLQFVPQLKKCSTKRKFSCVFWRVKKNFQTTSDLMLGLISLLSQLLLVVALTLIHISIIHLTYCFPVLTHHVALNKHTVEIIL